MPLRLWDFSNSGHSSISLLNGVLTLQESLLLLAPNLSLCTIYPLVWHRSQKKSHQSQILPLQEWQTSELSEDCHHCQLTHHHFLFHANHHPPPHLPPTKIFKFPNQLTLFSQSSPTVQSSQSREPNLIIQVCPDRTRPSLNKYLLLNKGTIYLFYPGQLCFH